MTWLLEVTEKCIFQNEILESSMESFFPPGKIKKICKFVLKVRDFWQQRQPLLWDSGLKFGTVTSHSPQSLGLHCSDPKSFGNFMWRVLQWEELPVVTCLDADWQHFESSSELQGWVVLGWKRAGGKGKLLL